MMMMMITVEMAFGLEEKMNNKSLNESNPKQIKLSSSSFAAVKFLFYLSLSSCEFTRF